ncbi:MAG: helix-turn-helix domain-containing protein [Mycobacterium sp.]
MPRKTPSKEQASAPAGADVHDRIVQSARELFIDKGYQATTTKEISSRAGVAEPTLFRRFGSKAEIFEASILPAVMSFVEGWSGSWAEFSRDASYEEMAENFTADLYTLIRQDRRVFQELLAARSDPNDDLYPAATAIGTQLRRGLRLVYDAGRRIEAERGMVGLDPPATVGAIASLIIGAAILDDWVFPYGVRIPGQSRMIREMSRLIADGISHRTV